MSRANLWQKNTFVADISFKDRNLIKKETPGRKTQNTDTSDAVQDH